MTLEDGARARVYAVEPAGLAEMTERCRRLYAKLRGDKVKPPFELMTGAAEFPQAEQAHRQSSQPTERAPPTDIRVVA